MKYFITILFIPIFFSCQSGRAREFNSLLDSTDRKVFRILVADSLERNRLEALVARKPDVAPSIGKKQASRLESIIREVDQTNVMGIDDEDRLKKSTTSYSDLPRIYLTTVQLADERTLMAYLRMPKLESMNLIRVL